MPIVDITGLEKGYGDLPVLEGIDLAIEEGEMFGLLGPNGVGKTTLFQTVIGLLTADAGTVEIDGISHEQGKTFKEKVSYLPATVNFYGDMTARQNLAYFARLADTDPDIADLLDLVSLSEDADRPVGEFSTGMKKRLGIAQSLIKDPPVLIYDEPTTGLDPAGKRNFRRHAEKINREHDKTIIISSHVTTEISPLCDRFGVLYDGTIVAEGTAAELNEQAGTGLQIRIETPDQADAEAVIEEMGVDYRTERNTIIVTAEADVRATLFDRLVAADVTVETIRLTEDTLETAYLALTEGS